MLCSSLNCCKDNAHYCVIFHSNTASMEADYNALVGCGIFFFFSSSGAQCFNSKNLFHKEKLSDNAAEMHLFLCPLAYANIAFIRRACSPYGAL